MRISTVVDNVMNDCDEDADSVEYEEEYDSSEVGRSGLDEQAHQRKVTAGSRDWLCESGVAGQGADASTDTTNRKRKFVSDPPNQNHAIAPQQGSPFGNGRVKSLRLDGGVAALSAPEMKKNGAHQNDVGREKRNGKDCNGFDRDQARDLPKGWTRAMHRQFVEAIYEIGINHASPSVIIEHMSYLSTDGRDRPEAAPCSDSFAAKTHVTSERVKSHLQKHRVRSKSKSNKDKFIREYDRWMQKALNVVGGISAAAKTSLASSPTAVVAMVGEAVGDITKANKRHDLAKMLLGGDVPAYLTFAVLLEEERAKIEHQRAEKGQPSQFERDPAVADAEMSLLMLRNGGELPVRSHKPQVFLPSAMEYAKELSGARIPLPVLTEEEQQSSLGVSISHVVGLFYSMTHTLIKERKKNQHVMTSNPANGGTSEGMLRRVSGMDAHFGANGATSLAPSVITPQYMTQTQGSHAQPFYQTAAANGHRDCSHVTMQQRHHAATSAPLFPSDPRYKRSFQDVRASGGPNGKHNQHPLAEGLHYSGPSGSLDGHAP